MRVKDLCPGFTLTIKLSREKAAGVKRRPSGGDLKAVQDDDGRNTPDIVTKRHAHILDAVRILHRKGLLANRLRKCFKTAFFKNRISKFHKSNDIEKAANPVFIRVCGFLLGVPEVIRTQNLSLRSAVFALKHCCQRQPCGGRHGIGRRHVC